MGIKYQKRNRLEELKSLDDVTLASIGDTDMEIWQYDYTQIADEINESLDKIQADYNKRFNFPSPK